MAEGGVANVSSDRSGLLAGFTLCAPDYPEDSAATVMWLEPNGSWSEASDIVEAQLEIAARDRAITRAPAEQLSQWLALLAGPIRNRMTFTRSRRWMAIEPTAGARKLLSRLQRCMKTAARRRDAGELADLERAIAFVAGGHTAGEAMLLERLAQATDSELRQLLPTLPGRRQDWDHLDVPGWSCSNLRIPPLPE
ncbi:MAG TPA: hypothetical protein VFZ87_09375 [Gemmatimonadales bacterium]